MHTVVLLAHALNLAERLGYVIRQEWLEGNGGGGCELRGRRFLFIDLAAPPADQFEMVLGVLRGEPRRGRTVHATGTSRSPAAAQERA